MDLLQRELVSHCYRNVVLSLSIKRGAKTRPDDLASDRAIRTISRMMAVVCEEDVDYES